MQRGRFVPKQWYSEDGKWLYVLYANGSIDMLPSPKLLFSRITNLPKAPTIRKHEHIHWAFKKEV